MQKAYRASTAVVALFVSSVVLCAPASGQEERSQRIARPDPLVVSSSLPSTLALRADGAQSTLVIQGAGFERITSVRVVDEKDVVVRGIRIVGHSLTKDLATLTFSADDGVTSGDYYVVLNAGGEVTTVPLGVLIQDLDRLDVLPNYDIRIRFPVHLSQINDEVIHAKVGCFLTAGVNAFLGSGERKIELTNGSFDGTVNVDCVVAEEYLPQDVTGWTCSLHLVVPHDTMGTLANLPAQSATNPAYGAPTRLWARAADDTPFTNRVRCFRDADDPNSSFADPETLSCSRYPEDQ